MKRIHFRIDDWLSERLKNFDLTVHECVSRVVKKIKQGKLVPEEMIPSGKLCHVITVDIPDEYADIKPNDIRDGLMQVFRNLVCPEPKIDKEDLKYKGIVEREIM